MSRTLLAVPLQVKDRVLGVVEVINRKDGLPFVGEDTDLLTAFAGQAAVAIENARLYTLTDQELAARVEELSVMQRIDRELNASLEMDRAMQPHAGMGHAPVPGGSGIDRRARGRPAAHHGRAGL